MSNYVAFHLNLTSGDLGLLELNWDFEFGLRLDNSFQVAVHTPATERMEGGVLSCQ